MAAILRAAPRDPAGVSTAPRHVTMPACSTPASRSRSTTCGLPRRPSAAPCVRTPTTRSRTLSAITGADVWVKFENLQYTASFKERGARNRLLALDEDERRLGVVAMSAGNHAQAVAHHATLLSIPSTIVMPVGTPANKISRTEDNGATVVVDGETLEDAAAVARRIAAETRRHVHPALRRPADHRRPGNVRARAAAGRPAARRAGRAGRRRRAVRRVLRGVARPSRPTPSSSACSPSCTRR